MKGIIGFQNLRIDCIIGVLPHERLNEQSIYIDLKVKPALENNIDNLEKTIDYITLSQLCQHLANSNFQLIETYAISVIRKIFENHPVSWAWIRVRKPSAIANSDGAIVEFEEGIR